MNFGVGIIIHPPEKGRTRIAPGLGGPAPGGPAALPHLHPLQSSRNFARCFLKSVDRFAVPLQENPTRAHHGFAPAGTSSAVQTVPGSSPRRVHNRHSRKGRSTGPTETLSGRCRIM